ncbi:cell wall protein [Streptomyces sp. JB150]|uniref:cell wall protein n=1 Tax=Streptomyces sp. JB150 TaxID=2714844 RepID=UPI00140B7FED|nr:cell wall protein [Streptomyces sp. JB150]QIJ64406.1 cell wall protein [Streptomyces sp. JB150]
MSSARRPLLTATAAGTLLGALWFVPSANATSDEAVRQQDSATRAGQAIQAGEAGQTGHAGQATEDRRIDQAGQAVRVSQEEQGAQDARTAPTTQVEAASLTTTSEGETRLADTGSFDSTPYVVGGTLSLTVGAGFVVYSVRRERLGL